MPVGRRLASRAGTGTGARAWAAGAGPIVRRIRGLTEGGFAPSARHRRELLRHAHRRSRARKVLKLLLLRRRRNGGHTLADSERGLGIAVALDGHDALVRVYLNHGVSRAHQQRLELPFLPTAHRDTVDGLHHLAVAKPVLVCLRASQSSPLSSVCSVTLLTPLPQTAGKTPTHAHAPVSPWSRCQSCTKTPADPWQ